MGYFLRDPKTFKKLQKKLAKSIGVAPREIWPIGNKTHWDDLPKECEDQVMVDNLTWILKNNPKNFKYSPNLLEHGYSLN